MYRKPSKRQQTIRLVVVYSIMIVAVLILVSFVTLLMLGYRFNMDDGRLEQYALLQFSSSPSGATVSIDGEPINSKTPNKATVKSGIHDIKMWREGYKTWTKYVDIKPGTVKWITYPLLIPERINIETVKTYEKVYYSLASDDKEKILVQEDESKPIFSLVEIDSEKIQSSVLTIDQSIFSASKKHSFKADKWDSSNRYVIIKHTFDNKIEWLVLDTQNANLTKNLTKIFNIPISTIDFVSSNGNRFYVLSNGTIRELDLASETISKSLIDQVASFSYYEESKAIAFRSKPNSKNLINLGIYVSGDERAAIINSVSNKNINHIITSKYFNENYITISNGENVTIMSGSYPTSNSDEANSLKEFTSFKLDYEVEQISFSPSGQYVLVVNDNKYATYDLEYQTLNQSTISQDKINQTMNFEWLDNNYLWSDNNNQLVIREFDGQNSHNINSVVTGQSVVMTKNERYIYSFNQLDSKIHLQRARIILP